MVFLAGAGLINDWAEQEDEIDFEGHKLWSLEENTILNIRYLYGLASIICPASFASESDENDNLFDELLIRMKEYFLNKNFDGKSLFRVLSKQSRNERNIKPEILWKVLELIFVVGFFEKDEVDSDGVFNKSLSLRTGRSSALLTKCVIQIVGDTLRQFSAVVAEKSSSKLQNFKFDLAHQKEFMSFLFDDADTGEYEKAETDSDHHVVFEIEDDCSSGRERFRSFDEPIAKISEFTANPAEIRGESYELLFKSIENRRAILTPVAEQRHKTII